MLLACATLTSCAVVTTHRRVTLESESALYVYLEPFPQDAGRLSFRIQELSALTTDGIAVPLPLSLTAANALEIDRERLLGGGPLPFGSYSGLTLVLTEPSLAGQSGGALRTPEGPIRIEIPFAVERRRAVVLSLRLGQRDASEKVYRFDPVFSATVAGKPASGLIGLATNCGAGTLTVFDKVTGRVAAVVPAGRSPGGLDVDPLRLTAYVALSREDAVEVIDLQQYRSVDRIQLFGGDRPVEVALTPDRTSLLVVNNGSDSLSIVDLAALSESDRISVGEEPRSVLIDGTGRQAYVFNARSGSVSVVDLTAGEVAATIATDPAPVRGQLNRRGDRLYVIHSASPYLTVVDTTSASVLERVYVGTGATALKVDPVTDRIYLARRNALEIDVYAPFSLLPVDSIPVPGDVAYLTIDDEGNNLAVVLRSRREILVLRLVGEQTVAQVDVGEDPCWAALLGER